MSIHYTPYRIREEYLYIDAKPDGGESLSQILADIGEKFADLDISSIEFNYQSPSVLLMISELGLELTENEESGRLDRHYYLEPAPVKVRGRQHKVDWSEYEKQVEWLRKLAVICDQGFDEDNPRLYIIG